MQTRIMLVEDRVDFRHIMASLLSRQPDLEVVAQAKSLDEARSHTSTVRFDVVVLDIVLPDGNGADLIGELRAANPDVAVLVLSASLDPENLERATEAGADEIVDKFASPSEILEAIRRIRAEK